MPATTTDTAHLRVMSDEERGAEIKRRRLALGIDSIHKFAEATERDRQTLTRVEEGTSTKQTYEWVEHWLDRIEEETGSDAPAASSPLRVTFHDLYGIGEVIIEAGNPDEAAEAVARLLAEVRKTNTRDGG